jgi:hypothetical protein
MGEIGADVLQIVECLFNGPLCGGVDGGYLILQRDAIGRQGLRDVQQLTGDDVAYSAEKHAGEAADDGDGRQAGKTYFFQTLDSRAKQEGECEGEGKGNDKLARKVQDKDEDREQKEGFTSGELGWSSTGHCYPRGLSVVTGPAYRKSVAIGAWFLCVWLGRSCELQQNLPNTFAFERQ